MSFRMLRKLQQGTQRDPVLELASGEQDDELSEEDDERDLKSGKEVHLNPFDLLNQQSLSESEVKEDDNETEHASAAANLPAGGAPQASKQKKKKKRKKKTKHSANHISSEDNDTTDKYASKVHSIMAEGSKVNSTKDLQLVSQQVKTSDEIGSAISKHVKSGKRLFNVELKHLNPQNEMRRTFGKRVVKLDNKRGRQKLTLKCTYMVSAKESWPPITKNIISMKITQPPENTCVTTTNQEKLQWFTYEHSIYYQGVQNLFLAAVERTDSDFLINLIRSSPYHVDSLIQLSELCKMTEDFSLAAKLIERALFVLESSLHPSFSLTSGNCRLDYRRQENRPFFIVLFKHAQYLEARACTRTAFELSKLIYNLNPDMDPLVIVLIIDYYAMRCKQYNWLVDFYKEYDYTRNLSQLPNMAYSYALALFMLHGDCEESNNALEYALLMFPGVLRPLLDELNVQTDKKLLASSYFNYEVSNNQSPALHQLVCLYVCRAKVIWRQNEVLPWLESNVSRAIDLVEKKDSKISEYSQKRAARYVTPPRAILRHVVLSDYKEKVPLAPFVSKEDDSIVMYDPLPPLDSINCYERKPTTRSTAVSTNNHPSNSISMFFHSMLPSFSVSDSTRPHQPAGEPDPQLQEAQRQPLPAAVDTSAVVPAVRQANNSENHGIELIGEGVAVSETALVPAHSDATITANSTQENTNDNEVVRHWEDMDHALAAAADTAAAIRNGQSQRSDSAALWELTESLSNIIDAMRLVLNIRLSEHLQLEDGEENDSSGDSSDYFYQ